MRAQRLADAHREETAPQRRIDAIARSLPDSLFTDHPEVIRLAREAEARAKGLASATSVALAAALASLQERLVTARERLADSAVDDGLRGDYEFTGALADLDEIDRLARQIQAATLAYKVLSLSPPEKRAFVERAQAARTELANLLFRLKQQHGRNHPELLITAA